MKNIPLTRGFFAQVDDEDYDFLNQWKWYAKSSRGKIYAAKNVQSVKGQRQLFMHRLVMKVNELKTEVDHIDGDGLNNKKINLRTCTRSENCRNRKPYGSSPYLGVSWYGFNNKNKWSATIKINGRQKCLGYFSVEAEAAIAYNKAASLHHGEFARLNII